MTRWGLKDLSVSLRRHVDAPPRYVEIELHRDLTTGSQHTSAKHILSIYLWPTSIITELWQSSTIEACCAALEQDEAWKYLVLHLYGTVLIQFAFFDVDRKAQQVSFLVSYPSVRLKVTANNMVFVTKASSSSILSGVFSNPSLLSCRTNLVIAKASNLGVPPGKLIHFEDAKLNA